MAVLEELLAVWLTLSFHGVMLMLLTRLHDMIIERRPEKDERN